MKSLLRTLTYPLLAVAVLLFAHHAMAEAPTDIKPLVVVRFNQPDVQYAQALYQALGKAIAVKPSVMLDVVSVAPTTGNPQTDAAWQQTASRNAQGVIGSLQSMGVPLSRMNISGQTEAGLRYDEVRIFVH